ncbi:hypothetical protein [Herbaspirillum frisingense]|uniref:hypothetical protein n=1 Tax=Herbaspirillum frisingense TaxID=92645 RepID=UPI00191D7B5B|nr:hypothetical protein [Herbaspirillum frisingense]
MSDLGQAIRHQVLGWVGVPVCVGIGATKTLANHIAKKQPQFAGVCDLSSLPSARSTNCWQRLNWAMSAARADASPSSSRACSNWLLNFRLIKPP